MTHPTSRPRRSRIRRVLLGLAILLAVILARPAFHLARTAWEDTDERPALPAGWVDDASRMNATSMREIVVVDADPAAAEAQLAALLDRARREGLRVSVAGTRHSMGGHTLYPGGIAVDMLPFDTLSFDPERRILTAGAGATWKQVLAFLDPLGFSVGVMQSDNAFSVGGSVSVNCHGWQYGRPPIASTVESFRLMKADGSIVRCSRTENADLFGAALGGYGLFGVILDVDLRVVPNERYRLEPHLVRAGDALATFDEEVLARDDVVMAYARISIVPDDFLGEVIINVFHRDPAPDDPLPPLDAPGLVALRRSIFRGSAGSDYGKGVRWQAETRLEPQLAGSHFSRNQLLNQEVEVFENRRADSTDILHEYFVPREGVEAFVADVRRLVPEHEADVMNVTVRYVAEDTDTLLRYADGPMIAFVMLFHQGTSAAADAAMEALTRDLIDASLAAGGRYYLPYRLHATREQFERAYPMAEEFFALKRRVDPDGVFRNRFSAKYGPEGLR